MPRAMALRDECVGSPASGIVVRGGLYRNGASSSSSRSKHQQTASASKHEASASSKQQPTAAAAEAPSRQQQAASATRCHHPGQQIDANTFRVTGKIRARPAWEQREAAVFVCARARSLVVIHNGAVHTSTPYRPQGTTGVFVVRHGARARVTD